MKPIRNIALILAAAFALSYVLFRAVEIKVVVNGQVLPIAAPAGAALITSIAAIACALSWHRSVERKKKELIKGLFGTSLSPALVEHMARSGEAPQLGGHEREITAYFSSIQSYSSFSESLPPARLVELLSEYLTACTEIVQEEGGTLDKYLGDAVIAMFGAPNTLPDHAYRACVAAQRVQLKLGDLRAKWQSEGEKWPALLRETRSQIGLNTGPCMVGNFGSRIRFNYSMMGSHVNLAARMQAGARNWGAHSMCTEATRAACVQHGGDRVVFRPLGRIAVMGRTEPLPIHEITGLKESIAPSTRQCLGLFEQGLARYYARDWDGAIQQFQQSAVLEPLLPDRAPGVQTNPSLVYLRFCQHYKTQPPPAKWNGTFVVTER